MPCSRCPHSKEGQAFYIFFHMSTVVTIFLTLFGRGFNAWISTVFDDSCVDFYDSDHSHSEQRYIIVGISQRQRLLVVSYTERGDTIRLISARPAP